MDKIQKFKFSPISEKYKTKLHKIYERIPIKVLKKRPEIEKLVFPEPLIIYEGLSRLEKSEKIKIPKGISESKEKKINSLNEFKDVVYNFNKMEKLYISNDLIKKENKIFAKEYKRLLKEKNKFSTGTYLDQKYLIAIANHYAQKGMKIPKISNDKNIFKSNPLILTGVDLENYFLYNLGEKYKSSIYLEKLDEIVNRKLTGNYALSDEEIRRLEFLKENEKPKGYIPLDQLIPKLQNDIIKTQNTIDNLEKENNNKDNSKDNNNENIINNNFDINTKEDNNSSAKTRNKQNNKYFDYSTNMTLSSRKIKIKKSLSLINYNKYTSRINSSASTKANKSKRFSFLNSHIALPYIAKNNKSNINSAISRDKTRLIYPVEISKKNILNYLKQKLLESDKIRDLFSGKKQISKTINSENINTINSLNSANSISKNKKILRKSLKSINSINSLTSIGKGSLISAISKDSKKNILNLKKEIPKATINNNINNENKVVVNIFKGKEKEIDGENQISIETQRKEEDREEDSYKKCESMFDKILQGKFQTNRSKSVLSDFLKGRGYKRIKNFSNKDNVLNLHKMRNKSIERNYILEEFKLRNGDNGKIPLTEQQQAIINKNESIIKKLQKNVYQFRKIICEKNIDKEE